MYRQFRIHYEEKPDIGKEFEQDEAEFDIEDADFPVMFNELISLFNTFSREQRYWATEINYIEEVPYDGEDV